jgi:hypothetical protein
LNRYVLLGKEGMFFSCIKIRHIICLCIMICTKLYSLYHFYLTSSFLKILLWIIKLLTHFINISLFH